MSRCISAPYLRGLSKAIDTRIMHAAPHLGDNDVQERPSRPRS